MGHAQFDPALMTTQKIYFLPINIIDILFSNPYTAFMSTCYL